MWPSILERRPGTTARIAGANAGERTRRLAASFGWEVVADFPDVGELCAGSRLALVPLEHTAGIQIKVLEAAAVGLAQVVTPAAIRGMRPGFPVTVAATDDEMVTAVVELLDDPRRRAREGAAAARHMARHYTAAAWSAWPSTLSTQ
jgi:glycosyltransferase involved in cell wall biosynthesis